MDCPARRPKGEADFQHLKQMVIDGVESAEPCWYDISEEWADLKKSFPEVIFIPASQDHGNEQKMTSDSSAFGKLFRVGIRKWLQADPASKDAINLLEGKVSEINRKILDTVETLVKDQVQIADSLIKH